MITTERLAYGFGEDGESFQSVHRDGGEKTFDRLSGSWTIAEREHDLRPLKFRLSSAIPIGKLGYDSQGRAGAIEPHQQPGAQRR